MKITKIKTRMGEFGAPVSTELEAIVERMRLAAWHCCRGWP